MRENITKVSQRGERLDALQDKTDNLAVSAQGFRRGANRVRKQMWWKDMKMRMCLIAGVIILILVIVLPSKCIPPPLRENISLFSLRSRPFSDVRASAPCSCPYPGQTLDAPAARLAREDCYFRRLDDAKRSRAIRRLGGGGLSKHGLAQRSFFLPLIFPPGSLSAVPFPAESKLFVCMDGLAFQQTNGDVSS